MRKTQALLFMALGALAAPAAMAAPSAQQSSPQPGAAQAGSQPGAGRFHRPANRSELQSMLEQHFARLDANHDGQITPDERQAMRDARRQRLFARFDKDGNGAISREEFDSIRPMRSGHARFAGSGGAEGSKWAEARTATVSKADFMARGLARFDQADTNHDGVISPEERAAMRARMKDRAPHQMPPPPPGG